jgi:hypothetical protein
VGLRVASSELEPSDNGEQLLWKGQPFTGIEVEVWPDGSPFSEAQYANGVLNGTSKKWFRSGELHLQEELRDGSLHGSVREWAESGRLVREATYEYGIKLRESRWDADGRRVDFVLREPDPNFAILTALRRQDSRSS